MKVNITAAADHRVSPGVVIAFEPDTTLNLPKAIATALIARGVAVAAPNGTKPTSEFAMPDAGDFAFTDDTPDTETPEE